MWLVTPRRIRRRFRSLCPQQGHWCCGALYYCLLFWDRFLLCNPGCPGILGPPDCLSSVWIHRCFYCCYCSMYGNSQAFHNWVWYLLMEWQWEYKTEFWNTLKLSSFLKFQFRCLCPGIGIFPTRFNLENLGRNIFYHRLSIYKLFIVIIFNAFMAIFHINFEVE